jgi:hypothetical protein
MLPPHAADVWFRQDAAIAFLLQEQSRASKRHGGKEQWLWPRIALGGCPCSAHLTAALLMA